MNIFLSHIAEEGRLAAAIKVALEAAIDDVQVFVSGVDIRLGQDWLDSLGRAFENSQAALVLCSPRSVARPWVNFESGGGWGHGIQVVPICHAGLTRNQLPHPLAIFQAVTLARGPRSAEDVIRKLVAALDRTLKPQADVAAIAATLSRVADGARSVGNKVGIVRTANQTRWPHPQYQSIFDLLDGDLPRRLGRTWPLELVDDPEQLSLDSIWEFQGLIVGSPWRAKFDADTIEAVRQFVLEGGRALLLGFELGDRHHDANLSELAGHFGIVPVTDIVGPASETEKPWYVVTDFEVGAATTDTHPLTTGLRMLHLANVQTLNVEPGGTEWLRVGANAVFRPRREKAVYASDGTFTAGKLDFDRNTEAAWRPVAVEAPRSLCGNGGVNAIGTWDLLGKRGEFLANRDNALLVERLFDWLSGA